MTKLTDEQMDIIDKLNHAIEKVKQDPTIETILCGLVNTDGQVDVMAFGPSNTLTALSQSLSKQMIINEHVRATTNQYDALLAAMETEKDTDQ